MNNYTFEEISKGMKEYFSREITLEDLQNFEKLSRDSNPLHCDEDYARERGFPGRVVYGLLLNSFISSLIGMMLPGKYALILNINSNFRKPAFVGDKLEIIGEVTEKLESIKSLVVKFKIINQKKEELSDGAVRVKLLK